MAVSSAVTMMVCLTRPGGTESLIFEWDGVAMLELIFRELPVVTTRQEQQQQQQRRRRRRRRYKWGLKSVFEFFSSS
jgi:hypothetical protein